jgi:hypothetical protein
VAQVSAHDQTAATTQQLRDALAELVVSVRYREPRTDWLAWRSQAIETARGLLTEDELERAEKMFARAADFEDLTRG